MQERTSMLSSEPQEWPFSKVVFGILICTGYVCAAVSFLLMARVLAL
jgi:hypothetical protein